MIRKFINILLFVISATVVYATEPDSAKELKIILIRHAKVDQKRPLLCSASKAVLIYKQYNEKSTHSFEPERIRRMIPEDQQVVFSSTMIRAIETARILFPEADTIITSPLFDEYSLPMVSIPLLPLPYPAWTFLSRFFWITRLNSHGETRRHAIKRMKQATNKLIDLTQKQGTVMVVCHGYIIRDIRKQLKNRGWQIEINEGNKTLSVSKFTKKIPAGIN